MTKDQAKQAISDGKKVTHSYFLKDEFIMKYHEDGKLLLEDGTIQVESEFWKLRSKSIWDNGWEIIK